MSSRSSTETSAVETRSTWEKEGWVFIEPSPTIVESPRTILVDE